MSVGSCGCFGVFSSCFRRSSNPNNGGGSRQTIVDVSPEQTVNQPATQEQPAIRDVCGRPSGVGQSSNIKRKADDYKTVRNWGLSDIRIDSILDRNMDSEIDSILDRSMDSTSKFDEKSVFRQPNRIFHGISGCNLVILKSILADGIMCRRGNSRFINRAYNVHPDSMISCSFAPKDYDPKTNNYEDNNEYSLYSIYSKSISFVVDSSNVRIKNLMKSHSSGHPLYPGSISLGEITGIVIGDEVRNKPLSELPIYDGEQVPDPEIISNRRSIYFFELQNIKNSLPQKTKDEIEKLFPIQTEEEKDAVLENLPNYAEKIFSKLLGIEKPTLLDFVSNFLPSDKKIYDSYGMEVIQK